MCVSSLSVNLNVKKNTGLRGIKVADTAICKVDGEGGNLYYRGYDINDLAQRSTYEETVFLLLHGHLPTQVEINKISKELSENRNLPQEVIFTLQQISKSTPSMAVLQSILALLSGYDTELQEGSKDANLRISIRIIAILPTIVAAWERIRNQQMPINPDKNLSHAANFLYMLHGQKPDPEIARYFDIVLLLHAEHTFNTSTFTGRVIASTQADMYASISGAIGSLSGDLHGGANAAVMRNLLEIGEVSNVESWVKRQLDSNKRISGMGHAVYKTIDPRAKILKDIGQKLSRDGNGTGIGKKLIEITSRMIDVTQKEFMNRKGRNIYPNVDCWTASVYSAMNIPVEAFTPIFTLARAAGWAAHVIEQQHPEIPGIKPVLYRPSADFSGQLNQMFIPLDKRGLMTGSSDSVVPNLEVVVRQVVTSVLQQMTGSSSFHALSFDSPIQIVKTGHTSGYAGNVNQASQSSKSGYGEPERSLITEYEIIKNSQKGLKELNINPDMIVTPLARDKARELRIKLIFKD